MTPPHSARKPANARLAQPMIGGRRCRSANQPMGSAPSTRNAPDAAARNTIVPLLTPNALRRSGASTDSVADSSSSNERRSMSTTNVLTPPMRTALAERDLLLAHPGQEVGGEEHLLLRRCLLRLALGLGVEDRYGELRRLARRGGRGGLLVHVSRSSCPAPVAAWWGRTCTSTAAGPRCGSSGRT